MRKFHEQFQNIYLGSKPTTGANKPDCDIISDVARAQHSLEALEVLSMVSSTSIGRFTLALPPSPFISYTHIK